MAVLASIIDEGRIDWEQSRFLEFEELDQDIVKRYNESKDRNPWYLSGRGYFPAEK